MEKRFKALRTIGSIFKVLGVIMAVFTVIGALAACGLTIAGSSMTSQFSSSTNIMSGALGGVLIGVVILLYGGISSLTMYGMGELVFLLIDMEENTRASAEASRATSALLQILSTPKPPTPPAPPAPRA
jgi:hypothetical protein